ncbi:MAG: SUMF1/EgtB/PvdO family nonheme iron enzyme [Acidobacteria bacterium]|nr:SUMF1/EgtB/PvdO family nonheme iron enzyme [Acidobacteriota bacterium]
MASTSRTSETRRMIGRTVGDAYIISEWLGSGAFGNVYKVKCGNTVFALKIADQRANQKLVFKEANHAATVGIDRRGMSRRHLCQIERVLKIKESEISDNGITDTFRVGLVFEFVGGGTLREQILTSKPIETALRLWLQILEGLDQIHSEGVMHLDLKPENVLLTSRDAEAAEVKITDYGLAELVGIIRQTGGTPAYMSPESLSQTQPSILSDLWAVAVIGYELLTGTVPFSVRSAKLTVSELEAAFFKAEVWLPEELSPFRAFFDRAFHRSVYDRFQSAAEMVNQIELIRSEFAGPALQVPVMPDRGSFPGRILSSALFSRLRRHPHGHPISTAASTWKMFDPASRSKMVATLAVSGALLVGGAWIGWKVFSSQFLTPPPISGPTTPTAPVGMIYLTPGNGKAAFFLDRYEVTNGDYDAFLGSDAARRQDGYEDRRIRWELHKQLLLTWQATNPNDNWQRYPVTNVTWFDAMAFAQARGRRLPTSEELESASLGVKTNDTLGQSGPLHVDHRCSASNPFGIIGLSCNVSEWTSTSYSDQASSDQKLIIGGNWQNETTLMYAPPTRQEGYIGFRCAADPPPPGQKGSEQR